MRIGIVGNGLAGVSAAKALRELDPAVEVELFARELHHYYPRPNLIEFLSGALPREKVFAFPEEWYERLGLTVRLGSAVETIAPETLEVRVQDGRAARFGG